MRAQVFYNPVRWRRCRGLLALGMAVALVVRPTHGGVVIQHEHGSHGPHVHFRPSAHADHWHDGHPHDHGHTGDHGRPAGEPDSLPESDCRVFAGSFNAVPLGEVQIPHVPLLARALTRTESVPLLPGGALPLFTLFAGVPPGPDAGLTQTNTETFPEPAAGLSATAALLLRGHALLI